MCTYDLHVFNIPFRHRNVFRYLFCSMLKCGNIINYPSSHSFSGPGMSFIEIGYKTNAATPATAITTATNHHRHRQLPQPPLQQQGRASRPSQQHRRLVYAGWISIARVVSVVREIFFDPEQQVLRSLPAIELEQLRSATPLAANKPTVVAPGSTFTVIASGASVADVVLNVDVFGNDNASPAAAAASAFGIGVLGGSHKDKAGRTGLVFNVQSNSTARTVLISGVCSKPAKGKVTPVHCVACPGVPMTLPAGEGRLSVRILIDRSVVELFAGNGRTVCSGSLARPPEDQVASVYIANNPGSPPLAVGNTTVFGMGCSF